MRILEDFKRGLVLAGDLRVPYKRIQPFIEMHDKSVTSKKQGFLDIAISWILTKSPHCDEIKP